MYWHGHKEKWRQITHFKWYPSIERGREEEDKFIGRKAGENLILYETLRLHLDWDSKNHTTRPVDPRKLLALRVSKVWWVSQCRRARCYWKWQGVSKGVEAYAHRVGCLKGKSQKCRSQRAQPSFLVPTYRLESQQEESGYIWNGEFYGWCAPPKKEKYSKWFQDKTKFEPSPEAKMTKLWLPYPGHFMRRVTENDNNDIEFVGFPETQ